MEMIDTELLSFLQYPIEQFHDRSTRWLLEDKENVRGLLEIVREHLVPHIDFEQLVHINRSFIPDNLREQESDLVYTVPFQNDTQVEELLIYILIEHQSTLDTTMGFRVLFYMTQIWDFQRREWESNNIPKSQRRLRPIIPIVFYTGEQKWQTPISLYSLMELPELLVDFVPNFEILFLSVKDTNSADLTKTDHSFGWLLTVLQKENATKEEIRTALIEAVQHIDTLDVEETQQWRRAIFYLYLLILHRRPVEEHDELKSLVHQQSQNTTHKEEGVTMAQTMAEFLIEQGEKEGEKRAEIRTKKEDIIKLLHIRFETVPDTIHNKITAIRSISRLNALFEEIATAQTLNDIDWDK